MANRSKKMTMVWKSMGFTLWIAAFLSGVSLAGGF